MKNKDNLTPPPTKQGTRQHQRQVVEQLLQHLIGELKIKYPFDTIPDALDKVIADIEMHIASAQGGEGDTDWGNWEEQS